jgi:hypothetical protein
MTALSPDDEDFLELLLTIFQEQSSHLQPNLRRSYMVQLLSGDPQIHWADLVQRYMELVSSEEIYNPSEPENFRKRQKRFKKSIQKLNDFQMRSLAQNFEVYEIND